MNITKVKLKKGGENGADIVHIGQGESHISELTATVQPKLIKAMAQYKEHLLRVCSYPEAKKKEEGLALLENLTMISVKCDGTRVLLAGRLVVLNGEDQINLISSNIEEETYDQFEELLDIFDDVAKEAITYMEKNSETKGRQFRIKAGEAIEEPNTETETESEGLGEIEEPAPEPEATAEPEKAEEPAEEVEAEEVEEEVEGF